MLASNWKLTYDPAGTPVVLVDYGSFLAEELPFTLDKSVEVIGLIDAAAPFIRVGKNAVVTFTLEVILENTGADADADARKAVMRSLLAAQTATKKPLKIEAQGVTDCYWLFANSTVKKHSPRRHLSGPAGCLAATHEITATGLTEVAVP